MGERSSGMISSKKIRKISFHKPRSTILRLDVLPFAILYAVGIFYYFTLPEDQTHYALIGIPVTGLLNVLFLLMGQWSVGFLCFAGFSTVSKPADATVVKVVPAKHQGKTQLRPLQKTQDGVLYFEYKTHVFRYDQDKNIFARPSFPSKSALSDYSTSSGLDSESAVAEAQKTFQKNSFDIPLPTFWELYKEHAIAPFFVFQIFCVLLWCLDEYWYYSLLTLFMLLFLESTIVKQRLRTLGELRSMRNASTTVQIFRNRKWQTVPSTEILPGDILSVTRSKEDQVAPCDALILSGSCVANESLLTGESIPQLKEGIHSRADTDSQLNIRKRDKAHCVFGGTKILQVNHTQSSNGNNTNNIPYAPDGGIPCYVLRTGFGTSQGKLMRTLMTSTEHVSVNSGEAFLFIGFLLSFAIAAAYHVAKHGLADPRRSRYKLLLNCILIVTSVVPPELPMELSLAVNASLIALVKFAVYCTEPFRIPFAGKIDVACFDKTGTLTSENLRLRKTLLVPEKNPEDAALVLGGCHSLMKVGMDIVGDPLEKAALSGIQWSLSRSGDEITPPTKERAVRIKHRHAFDSTLKRMCTIVEVAIGGGRGQAFCYALCKGAPEALKPLLDPATVPSNYDEVYLSETAEGARVIALALKPITDSSSISQIRSVPRSDHEFNLRFAGFAVFSCPIKPDSRAAVAHLRESSHKVVMITGDNALTACHVARETAIVDREVAIYSNVDGELKWLDVRGMPTSPESRDLCITGDAMALAVKQDSHWLNKWAPKAVVFARVSPDQKEDVMSAFKATGHHTLMCGDGTNDVGALKRADVGVALLNQLPATPQPKKGPTTPASPLTAVAAAAPVPVAPQQPPAAAPQDPKAAFQARLNELLAEQEGAGDEPSVVKLGDASIAAPFTAKSMSVASTLHVIRQGRCTLVTTLQMYKILALNCLISAYCLSVLYLAGVKFGDGQMFMNGILITVCFLFISRARPMEALSAERPSTRIFSPYAVLSIAGQFAAHLYTLIHLTDLASKAVTLDEADRDPEGEFKPNLVNTVVFLVNSMQQCSVFVNNYRGRPFMQGLTENTGLAKCLAAIGGVTLLCAAEIVRPLNEYLQLVPFPDAAFRGTLIMWLAGDCVVTFLWEHLLRWIFADRPKTTFKPTEQDRIKINGLIDEIRKKEDEIAKMGFLPMPQPPPRNQQRPGAAGRPVAAAAVAAAPAGPLTAGGRPIPPRKR